MPKNTIIPVSGGPPPAPPVPEQSIRFDRGRGTALRGYTPGTDESDRWVMSWWQKLTGELTLARTIWEARVDANNFTKFEFLITGQFRFEARIAGVIEAEFTSKRFMVDVSNWHHCHLRFDRLGGFLQFSINGYGYPTIQQVPFSSISNIPGYVWMNTTAEHVIANDSTVTTGFSGQIAEMHCVPALLLPPVTDFGLFNSAGVWERKVYAGAHGASGFYLPFSRTVDLGEDFSGNGNDFPTHTAGAPAGGDQFDDWMERNYCTLDVNDHRTIGAVSNGALDVNAAGVAHVTMRPHFGVWYYEVNGVATVWDTGISGDFDPAIPAASSVNFGQLPFVGVGPSGGEMTVNSNNFPATSTDIARDYVWSIEYNGDVSDPRVVSLGQGQSTIYDSEYSDILERVDLAIVKNAGPGNHWYLATRLRNGFQVTMSSVSAEESTNVDGYISDLPDPGPGVEMTKGGTSGDNVNEFGNIYSLFGLHIRAYAQNILVAIDEDDAEEEVSSGDTDIGSSDLEITLEGATPQLIGLRFLDLLIEQGSTILDARIQFEADNTNTGTNDVNIDCEDIDDAPTFVDGAGNNNISGRTLTGNVTAWSPPDWNIVQERAAAQLTSNFAGSVQDVIDRGGWAEGNALVAVMVGGATPGEREAEAFDGTQAPELQIKWRRPGVEADIQVSLFTYTGIGTARDVMHGNNAVPDLIALKDVSSGNHWVVYINTITTAGNPEDGRLMFNNTDAYTVSGDWDNTVPGGVFFRVGTTARVNAAGEEFSGFTIANLPGFSKVFRYVGNGSTSGPEIYLGFKPRFMVIKRTQAAGNWIVMHKSASIVDDQNNQFNLMENMGFLNTTVNLFQALGIDAFASGAKIRTTDADLNAAGQEYVGFAFAEANFQTAKATN